MDTLPSQTLGRCPATRRPLRVLVVDDHVDVVETAAVLLRLSGYEVDTALSGPEALQVANLMEPDIIFLDIAMPGMDGWEVVRRLRQSNGPSPLALVAVTAHGTEADRARSREVGFDYHLV